MNFKPAIVKPLKPIVSEEKTKKIAEKSSKNAEIVKKRKVKEMEESSDEENESDQENSSIDDDDSEEQLDAERKWILKQEKLNPESLKDEDEKNTSDNDNSDKEDDIENDEKDTKTTSTVDIPKEEIEKANCTIFVGNVPVAVISSKSLKRKFQRFWEKVGPVASMRFRSIAFSKLYSRKAAYINKELHEGRTAANAYVVFKSPEHVKKAVALNGTVFEEHHLRIDSVAHPAAHDNKRCIFVGNLDFEMDEEPLWRHFEECGEIEYVRIIRDSATNVGKGFCYVQFKDPVSVTKALMLNGKKIGGEKGRELRIHRSKNLKNPMKNGGNIKKKTNGIPRNKKARLTEEEKTKLGRATVSVGKAARSEIKSALEGTRSQKGDYVPGFSKKTKQKKHRIRERSTAYKQARKNLQN